VGALALVLALALLLVLMWQLGIASEVPAEAAAADAGEKPREASPGRLARREAVGEQHPPRGAAAQGLAPLGKSQ